MDRLLTRQLSRTVGLDGWSPELEKFIALVDRTYREHEADRRLSDHAMETVSAEVTEMNEQLRRKVRALEQLEVELRQAQKLEAVGQLAAGIAHEINTPIQFVGDSITFVNDALVEMGKLHAHYEVLVSAVERGDVASFADIVSAIREAEEAADLAYLLEHVPKAIARAQKGLNRVSVIVRAMKGFAHADSTDKIAADLNKAVTDTLVVTDNAIKYVADVELELGELPPVRCFLGDINQVFLNFFVNAAHAIEDVVEKTGERGKITVSTLADGPWAVVRIRDTGIGIPEAVRGRIFDPFFTTKEVGRGSGQGLAIAHNIIVGKHGGTITFDTVEGQGTTFELRIPIDGEPSP